MAPQALNLEHAVITAFGSIFSWKKKKKEKTIQEKVTLNIAFEC